MRKRDESDIKNEREVEKEREGWMLCKQRRISKFTKSIESTRSATTVTFKSNNLNETFGCF